MAKSWKLSRDVFALAAVAATVMLAILFGPTLPERVPSHFDLQGNVDGHMARTDFMVFIIGLVAGLYLLLTFIPFIDPFWRRIQPRYHVLMIFRDILVGFVLTIFIMTLATANEGHLPANLLGIALGVVFALLGNFLPKVPRNWFSGIRTPWTLVSDHVWLKSHIVGGWMFVASGLLTAILSALGVGLEYVLLPTLTVSVIGSGIVYPFLLSRRLEKSGEVNGGNAL